MRINLTDCEALVLVVQEQTRRPVLNCVINIVLGPVAIVGKPLCNGGDLANDIRPDFLKVGGEDHLVTIFFEITRLLSTSPVFIKSCAVSGPPFF